MDSVLSSLGTLINNIKNLTLPGLVAAFAFAILLWPPQPIDVVRVPTTNGTYAYWPKTKSELVALANNERRVRNEKGTKGETGGWQNTEFSPVCETKEQVLRQPGGLSDNKPVAVANQFTLEDIQRKLQDCADKETALSGAEQNLIADITAEIAVLTNERDAIRDTYVGYEKSANPLRGVFLDDLHKKEDEIRFKQAEIYQEEQLARERTRRSSELAHYSDEIKQRLLEPGRLRPLQKFDDFLASLGSHVIAFLTLAIAWSLMFDPINRAVFGIIYDRGFDDQLDYIWWDSNSRPTRISLTNQARAEQFEKVKTVYAAAAPDAPTAPPEPPPPLQKHKPPTPLSIWILLVVGVLLVIALAVIMWRCLSHTPTDAPNVGICLVNDCTVLQKAPNFELLFLGCVVATLAAMSFALGFTSAWSWWKARGRQKEVDVANSELQTSKAQMNKNEYDFRSKAGSLREQMKGLSGDAQKQKETELKDLEKKHEAEKKKQEAESKCPNNLAKQWLKIRQPEYAIGQGLITRDAYNSIRAEYYSQSTLSIGLILPVLLLLFALIATPQMGFISPEYKLSPGVWVCFILVQVSLVLVGADRRHKFDMEVETTIIAAFLKNCEAANKKADDSTPKPPTANPTPNATVENNFVVII